MDFMGSFGDFYEPKEVITPQNSSFIAIDVRPPSRIEVFAQEEKTGLRAARAEDDVVRAVRSNEHPATLTRQGTG